MLDRALTWDEYGLVLAEVVSFKSKDPSTKVGAVILTKDNKVLSTGFNGFPRGVEDLVERYKDRPLKYQLVAHAERNAIDLCQIRPVGATLYCNKVFVCKECAKSIIQSGITRVVVNADGTFGSGASGAWEQDQMITSLMFNEANVSLESVALTFEIKIK
jgi:dCMP deaminase